MDAKIEDAGRRARWLATLAGANVADLEAAWRTLEPPPEVAYLRRPETGLVMVRGRMGGIGRRFNLGEMTVTRCAVRLAGGAVGHGYVQGRDQRKAALVAGFDALLQTADGTRLRAELLEPLARAADERSREKGAKAAATRVDFFTLVRGDA